MKVIKNLRLSVLVFLLFCFNTDIIFAQSRLVESAKGLTCAKSSSEAKDILQKLSRLPTTPFGIPSDNTLASGKPRLYSASIDLLLYAVHNTIRKYPQLRNDAERAVLSWNYCGLVEYEKLFDLSLNNKGLVQRKIAQGFFPVNKAGLKSWGFLMKDPQSRYVPHIFNDSVTGPLADQDLFHRLCRQQCIPNPDTGESCYEIKESPLFAPLEMGQNYHVNFSYPYKWDSSCEVAPPVVTAEIEPEILEQPVEVEPEVTVEPEIVKVEEKIEPVRTVKKDPVQIIEPIKQQKIDVKKPLELAKAEIKQDKPVVKQVKQAKVVPVKKEQPVIKQVKKAKPVPVKKDKPVVKQAKVAPVIKETPKVKSIISKPAEEKQIVVKQETLQPEKQTDKIEFASTIPTKGLKGFFSGMAGIDSDNNQGTDSKPKTLLKQVASLVGEYTPPTEKEAKSVIIYNTAIANAGTGEAPVDIPLPIKDSWGFSGNFVYRKKLVQGHALGFGFGWSPFKNFFIKGGAAYKLDPTPKKFTYSWTVGYSDWRPGTFSVQLNNWGPIEIGEGWAFERSVVNLGYKIDAPFLRPYKLAASLGLSIPIVGDPGISMTWNWSPLPNYYIRGTISRKLGSKGGWGLSYNFGYSDWHPFTVSVGYDNWGPNPIFTSEDDDFMNFKNNGAVSLSYGFAF